jgi:hypothetical protein
LLTRGTASAANHYCAEFSQAVPTSPYQAPYHSHSTGNCLWPLTAFACCTHRPPVPFQSHQGSRCPRRLAVGISREPPGGPLKASSRGTGRRGALPASAAPFRVRKPGQTGHGSPPRPKPCLSMSCYSPPHAGGCSALSLGIC